MLAFNNQMLSRLLWLGMEGLAYPGPNHGPLPLPLPSLLLCRMQLVAPLRSPFLGGAPIPQLLSVTAANSSQPFPGLGNRLCWIDLAGRLCSSYLGAVR